MSYKSLAEKLTGGFTKLVTVNISPRGLHPARKEAVTAFFSSAWVGSDRRLEASFIGFEELINSLCAANGTPTPVPMSSDVAILSQNRQVYSAGFA